MFGESEETRDQPAGPYVLELEATLADCFSDQFSVPVEYTRSDVGQFRLWIASKT